MPEEVSDRYIIINDENVSLFEGAHDFNHYHEARHVERLSYGVSIICGQRKPGNQKHRKVQKRVTSGAGKGSGLDRHGHSRPYRRPSPHQSKKKMRGLIARAPVLRIVSPLSRAAALRNSNSLSESRTGTSTSVHSATSR